MPSMVPFLSRLEELKYALEQTMRSRIVFLVNPKDASLLRALTAWTAIPPRRGLELIQVRADATMDDLWALAEPDLFRYATALGCSIKEALPRFSQLRELGLLFPDGTIAPTALQFVKTYVAAQVEAINMKFAKSHGEVKKLSDKSGEK